MVQEWTPRKPRRREGFSWCRAPWRKGGVEYRLYWRRPTDGRLYAFSRGFDRMDSREYIAAELRRLRNNVRITARALRGAA